MGALDRIIDVTITRQSTTLQRANFGILLVAQEFLKADATPAYGDNERVRTFNSLTEVGDCFGTTSNQYYCASKIFAQNPSVDKIKIGRKLTSTDGSETWTEALDAMVLDDANWYALGANTRVEAEQQTIADWTETNERIYGISSGDTEIKEATAGDIASYLKTNNYERSFVIYSPTDLTIDENSDFLAEAWMGSRLPNDPGSQNWAFKTLKAVSTYTLSETEKNNVEDKNANYYINASGVDITYAGTVGFTNTYIDQIRGIDWLTATIQEDIFLILTQTDKIPYTDAGVDIIVSTLKGSLQKAVDANVITEDFEVSAPLVINVDSTDKAQRLLPDIEWSATFSGAINKVEIDGVISI